MGTSSARWTTLTDVLASLRRRWERGEFLTALAAGAEWSPLAIPLKGPTPREISGDFAAVQEWVRAWQSRAGQGRAGLRLESESVGGRIIGSNVVPRRVWVDSYQQLWALLGVAGEVRRFGELLAAAQTDAPRLAPWMTAHPMRVLALQPEWPTIVATVLWIDAHWRPGMYLRQIDPPGVDTKFIERHRGILTDLLDCQLDDDRIDSSMPRANFVRRYGFRDKPRYVRLRALGPDVWPYGGAFSELEVRVDELALAPPRASTVYIVENEITYLAFPPANDAIVIFGSGYAMSSLTSLTWLDGRTLVYWGDIDTHGFAILNRLRVAFPLVQSMLMDRATLVAHQAQWVREMSPVNAHLDRLSADETALYRDLVEDALGPALRLEQERVRFSAILSAIKTASRRPPVVSGPA